MTVQQERPTPTASPARVPEPRVGQHAPQARPQQAAAAAPPRGWGSAEDRTICRWLVVGIPLLGVYASTFVYLGTRVWG